MIGLHATEAGGADVGHGPIPYLLVADMGAALAQLKQHGVTIHSGPTLVPSGEPIATFYDSEGNAIGLCQKPS